MIVCNLQPPPPPEPVVKGQAVFHTDRSDSVTVPETNVDGGECVNSLCRAKPGELNRRLDREQSEQWQLGSTGHYEFKYQPRAGIKGADKYTIQICGKGPAGSGCSGLTYQVTVQ
jgi:hypothetical protein